MALPPLRIHVDNAQVVQGFRMGRPWCVRSRSYGADLWREVWDKYEDVGGGIEVVKVKAHTSWWEVLAGRISARDRAGNDLADKEAKKALKEAIKSSPIAAFNGHLARAVEWAKWMLRYAESWKDDTTVGQEQADELERHSEEEAGGGGKGRATMTHEKWEVGSEVACRRCGRRERKTGGGRKPLDDACLGSAAGRALAHATGHKNYVWKEFRHSEAEYVCQGAALTLRSRVPASMVDESRGEDEAGKEGLREEERDDGGFVEAWTRDPDWMIQPSLRVGCGRAQEETQRPTGNAPGRCVRAGSSGHLLRKTGAMVWCARCARFAQTRLGKGLKEQCVAGEVGGRSAAVVQKRLSRLHAGLHPITGRWLV